MKIEQYCIGQVQTNCYFAINEKTQEMLVIDPGDCAQLLAEKIKQKGLKPKAAEELAGIFGVKIYAHEAEKETLEQSGLNASGMIGRRDSYQADVFVKDGQVLQLAGMDLTVLHTPGHTEGGCCFYSEEDKVLFSGDTLFCQSVGRTDFPRGSMSQLIRSIRGKLLALPDDVKVYPGHMGVTTVGMERRGNPFIS